MNEKLKTILLYIVLPIVITSGVALYFYFMSKEVTQITFKLDGWITIGTVKSGELSNLQLMLDSEKVENITKVSWRIINTGDKGIEHFEKPPCVRFPNNLKVFEARVTEKRDLLGVAQKMKINNSQCIIDSLGIFNPGDFFKIDFYIRDIGEENVTNDYFREWDFIAKSLDLNIKKDLSYKQIKVEESKSKDSNWIIVAVIFGLFYGAVLSLLIYRRFRRKAQIQFDGAKKIKEDIEKGMKNGK